MAAIFTDADRIKEPAAAAPLRDILWQPSKELAGRLNTEHDDYEPRLSADGMTLYFVRGKAGENADIYFSQRGPSGWSEPQPVAALNSTEDDLGPEPSSDGQSLLLQQSRGSLGGYDLWVSRRRRTNGAAGQSRTAGQLELQRLRRGPRADGRCYISANRPRIPTSGIEPRHGRRRC
jgi:hypothetical protein